MGNDTISGDVEIHLIVFYCDLLTIGSSFDSKLAFYKLSQLISRVLFGEIEYLKAIFKFHYYRFGTIKFREGVLYVCGLFYLLKLIEYLTGFDLCGFFFKKITAA